MKETILSAIRHEQRDIIPYNVELTSVKRKALCDEVGIPERDYFSWAGNYIEKCDYNTGKSDTTGYYEDNFGVVWNQSGLDKDIGIAVNRRVTEENYKEYRCPEADIAYVRKSTETLLKSNPKTLKLGKISMTLFERAWSLRGMEEFLTDLYLNEELAERLLDQIMTYNLRVLDTALSYDIDGFYFADDFGTQNSMLMNPGAWRRFFKPFYRQMFDRVKSKGKITVLHSCGDIRLILGDLTDIGLDVYQTVQPEIYDLRKLKEDFGKDLCFWGGISTQRLLPFATVKELSDTVVRTIDIMAKGGGYIASPTHQVPADVPNENILALIGLLKTFRL